MSITLIVALAALPALSGADEPATLDVPGRVRVTVASAEEAGPLVGTLKALRDTSLLLQLDEGPRTIPFTAIHRVEVSRGRHVSGRWTTIGAVTGVAVGALVGGCLANKDDYGVACAGQDDTKYLIGGVVGGLAGGALGAWLGRKERWEPVDLDRLKTPAAAGPVGSGRVAPLVGPPAREP